jgi:predicted amidohydrolase
MIGGKPNLWSARQDLEIRQLPEWMMVRAWAVEWPDGLLPEGKSWDTAIQVPFRFDATEILVTNEMPFGVWQPVGRKFNGDQARDWVNLHERGLDALAKIPVAAVISSRPVLSGNKLANEAFALVGGRYEILHHKHFFPAEYGWEEKAWFETAREGFDVVTIAGLKIGVLLCTELMFPEKARWLGRLGADLIAVPRATGIDHRMWRTAASMAAIVSGAYVVSSNRTGQHDKASPRFGGGAFAVDVDGIEVWMSSTAQPAISVRIDRTLSEAAKSRYPVYVSD